MFPEVFAIYNHKTDSFHVYETVFDKAGLVECLRPWSYATLYLTTETPYHLRSSMNSHLMRNWYSSHKWFVIPASDDIDCKAMINEFTFENKVNYYWPLGYSLRWATPDRFEERNGSTIYKWQNSPTVPVIELFDSRSLPETHAVPAVRTLFNGDELLMCSYSSRMRLYHEKNVVESDLEYDTSSDEDAKNILVKSPTRSRSQSNVSTDSTDSLNEGNFIQFACLFVAAFLAMIYFMAILVMLYGQPRDDL